MTGPSRPPGRACHFRRLAGYSALGVHQGKGRFRPHNRCGPRRCGQMRSAAFSETLRRDQDPARTAARIMPPAAATGHRRARACPPHGPLAFDCACFVPSPIAVLPGLRHPLSLSTKGSLFAIQQLHLSHFFPKHTACLEFLRALWLSHFPARPWPARIRCAALVFRLAFVIEF